MSDNEEFPCEMMQKMDLSEDVSVTLPAHVWISFWSCYFSAEWTNHYASHVADAAQRAILHPDHIARREEQYREQQERVSSISFPSLFGGMPANPNRATDDDEPDHSGRPYL